MRRPTRAQAHVAATVTLVLVAGALATKQLTQGGASVRSTTLSQSNGTLQGLVHTGKPSGHPFVPFLGPFALHSSKAGHVSQCGPAVRLMEGALKRKKFRHDAPRNCVGPATKKQIKAFQRSLHYKTTGVYNQVTHAQMVRHGGYTNEARKVLVYLAGQIIVKRERSNVSTIIAHSIVVYGGSAPYSQGASRSYFPPWPRVPPATDCSGYATWVLAQAGAGAHIAYFGPGSSVGWTGTLTVQGHLVKPGAPLLVGDLVFYPSSSARGPPWGHVAVYEGHGLVASHGGVGINVLPYNYRPVGEIRRYIG
jgi:hypothetical protein